MGFDPDDLPVVAVFRGKALNGVTRLVLEVESVPTEYQRAKTLRETIDVSSSTFQHLRKEAISYGLIEGSVSINEAHMPRYRIPDSPTVQFLRSFHTQYDPTEDDAVSVDTVLLPDLMKLNGRARLIGWFLAAADPGTQYSRSKMADVAPVGQTTVRQEIETLAEYGIVTTHEASRGTQTYTTYQYNEQSVIADTLYDLNTIIARQRAAYEDDTDGGE